MTEVKKPRWKRTKEQNREYSLLLKKKNPEFAARQLEALRKWQKDNPEKVNLARLKREVKKYGITFEQYNEMLSSQNNVCKICKRPPKKHRLAVDHNHTTGEVRGLLCVPCNRAIGLVENHWEDIHEYLNNV